MSHKEKNEIRCYECHFRCYCGMPKQKKAMEENQCADFHYSKMDMRGSSPWGNYFSTPGY